MVRVQCDELVTITQVRVQYGVRFGDGECDFSFLLPAADDNRFETVSTAFDTFLMPKFRAWRPNGWAVNKVIVHDLWPGIEGDSVTETSLTPIPDLAGVSTPPQVTPLISWRTGSEGRNNRGRTFMGMYTAESIDADGIIDPALSAVYDFAEAMMANFGPGTPIDRPRFVIFSKWQDKEIVYPPFYSPVTNYYFFERWAVQRRRHTWDWRT